MRIKCRVVMFLCACSHVLLAYVYYCCVKMFNARYVSNVVVLKVFFNCVRYTGTIGSFVICVSVFKCMSVGNCEPLFNGCRCGPRKVPGLFAKNNAKRGMGWQR